MTRNLLEEAPDVVTEDGLRDLLRRGYHVDVIALEDAKKHQANWYGQWAIWAVSTDGEDARLLVISRSALKVRIFKTANGLITFLKSIGCPASVVLHYEGQKESLYPEERYRDR